MPEGGDWWTDLEVSLHVQGLCPEARRVEADQHPADRAASDEGASDEKASDQVDPEKAKSLLGTAAAMRPHATLADREGAGGLLMACLTPGRVGLLWERAQVCGTSAEPLRLSIEIAVPQLRPLPWELLRDDGEWLFYSPDFLCARRWAGDGSRARRGRVVTQGSQLGPLRVLVVVCNPDDGKDRSDEERVRIAAALGITPCAHVQFLEAPTRPVLAKELKTWHPHVLHFIGHGMPAVAGDEAALPINWVPDGVESGRECWKLTSSIVHELLAQWQPRLVVLSACGTAADLQDRRGGLAEAFLAARVGAVVSMLADIDSPVCAVFARELYREVADGAPVDHAVREARQTLSEEYTEEGHWALPVLATSGDPATALAIHHAPPRAAVDALCKGKRYQHLELFVDRSEERRTAWRALDPSESVSDRRLLVVSGASWNTDYPHTGKTLFTLSCLVTCFLRGHRITYVDLQSRMPADGGTSPRKGKRKGKKNWLELLRAVRAACLDGSQAETWRPEDFSRFNAELNALVRGFAPVPEQGGAGNTGVVEDEGGSFDENVGRSDERRRRIFRVFLETLTPPGDDRVHVLALDHADYLTEWDCRQMVYPELIEPVAAGTAPGALRLLLVATPNWIGKALPERDSSLWGPPLTLRDFDCAHLMRLADEFCERAGLHSAAAREVFAGYRPTLSRGVPVQMFGSIGDWLIKLKAQGEPL
ncbi:CHAT domain-containing protein [Kitasatospora sp. NPDC056181]|uniref:CHAT domain-containing protein n=1 Tax=Kitasatospora sp. NPDC056181 TaxID=3345737 RepID=UPI0035E281BE